MKIIKSFLGALVVGAGCYTGTRLIQAGIETARDPYKRATIKRKAKHIKDVLLKKEGES